MISLEFLSSIPHLLFHHISTKVKNHVAGQLDILTGITLFYNGEERDSHEITRWAFLFFLITNTNQSLLKISVQSLSHVHLIVTPWTAAHQASLSITNFWNSLKLMSVESVIPSNHLILCCLLFLLPSIFPSIRIFSNESILCIRWPKYWSFSFNIRNSGLISFRMDWLDLLEVQGTLKSLH